MRDLTCYCGSTFEADLPDRIDMDTDPDIPEKILKGDFLTVVCPFCGKELKPELPVTLVYDNGSKTLSFLPELSRNHFLSGKESCTSSEAVIGYPELVEWVRIRNAGLERAVIEALKYYYLRKTEKPGSISMFFTGMDAGGEKLGFHIHGLKEGEIGVSSVPRSSYDKVAADMGKLREAEPFNGFLAAPYISVNNISWAEG